MITPTHFILELEPIPDKREFYRFKTSITDFSNEKRVVEKAFIRDVEIIYLGQKKGLHVYDVFTPKIIFKATSTLENESLLKEAAYVFDALEIGVNNTGEIEEIFNLTEMKNRWKLTKLELMKDHEGYEFNDFVNSISAVLNDKGQVIHFLKSNKMFGLLFHGLYGQNGIQQESKKRTVTITEMDDIAVTEEIRVNKSTIGLVIDVQKTKEISEEMISLNNEIKKYSGSFSFRTDHQLQEASFEIENSNINIKYNVVWVG
jgi:hypothetical protein